LTKKGQPRRTWLQFLHNENAALDLDATVETLKTGICPLLLEASVTGKDGASPLLGDLIQLHGLFETLATYQAYLQLCWELAGFGGDHCVYDQLADAVTSILQELS